MKAIEVDFPFEHIDPIAEMESWRKEINRPMYYIHNQELPNDFWKKQLVTEQTSFAFIHE